MPPVHDRDLRHQGLCSYKEREERQETDYGSTKSETDLASSECESINVLGGPKTSVTVESFRKWRSKLTRSRPLIC